jgi:hypothetical protein
VAAGPTELIVCGWDEVFVWALDARDSGVAAHPGEPAPPGEVAYFAAAAHPGEAMVPRKIWSWRARGRADIPEAL